MVIERKKQVEPQSCKGQARRRQRLIYYSTGQSDSDALCNEFRRFMSRGILTLFQGAGGAPRDVQPLTHEIRQLKQTAKEEECSRGICFVALIICLLPAIFNFQFPLSTIFLNL